jgi:hypothetical protein
LEGISNFFTVAFALSQHRRSSSSRLVSFAAVAAGTSRRRDRTV